MFETDLLLQLDPTDPLLKLAQEIPLHEFDGAFSIHYTEGIGAPSKPIRLMVGLLILKQLEDLNDEAVGSIAVEAQSLLTWRFAA